MEYSAENIFNVHNISDLPTELEENVLKKFINDRKIRSDIYFYDNNNLYIVKFRVIYNILMNKPLFKYLYLSYKMKFFTHD